MTRTQAEALRRVRDHGPGAWQDGKDSVGGAVYRMFERLHAAGLVTIAFEITPQGCEALRAYDAAVSR